MKLQGVIGKRIVGIWQKRIFNKGTGRQDVDVIQIELENDWKLRPVVCDCAYDGDYAVDFVIVKPAKGGAK